MPKRDHPRSCGEQVGKTAMGMQIAGSPPLMRGTASPVQSFFQVARDHPRSCGEQYSFCISHFSILGSPPLMRGTVSIVAEGTINFRITPAHAGNRSILRPIPCGLRDHPRSCGEQVLVQPFVDGDGGSPPLMRGTDRLYRYYAIPFRITPAHAGNSPVFPF